MARGRPAHRGGAPRKAPEGLGKVLFIRANQELLDELEKIRRERSEESPGIVLSTADITRAILWDAIREKKEKK